MNSSRGLFLLQSQSWFSQDRGSQQWQPSKLVTSFRFGQPRSTVEVRLPWECYLMYCTPFVLHLYSNSAISTNTADKDFWEFDHASCVCNYLSLWWWFDVLYKPSYESGRRKWQQNVKVDFNAIVYGKHGILEWLLMTIGYHTRCVHNSPPPFQFRKEFLFYNLTDWPVLFSELNKTHVEVLFNLSVIVGVYNADIKKMRLHMNIRTAVTMWKLIRSDTAVRNMEVTVVY